MNSWLALLLSMIFWIGVNLVLVMALSDKYPRYFRHCCIKPT